MNVKSVMNIYFSLRFAVLASGTTPITHLKPMTAYDCMMYIRRS